MGFDMGSLELDTQGVREQDWAENWKKRSKRGIRHWKKEEKRRRELAIQIRGWASDTGIVPVKAVRTDGKFSS